MAYPCQRETVLDRTTRRAEKIRSRLGWEVGILNPPGNKPKGMHWQTFWKLDRQHNVFLRTSLGDGATVGPERLDYRSLLRRVLRMSAFGTKRTFKPPLRMSAIGGKADIPLRTKSLRVPAWLRR